MYSQDDIGLRLFASSMLINIAKANKERREEIYTFLLHKAVSDKDIRVKEKILFSFTELKKDEKYLKALNDIILSDGDVYIKKTIIEYIIKEKIVQILPYIKKDAILIKDKEVECKY